MQLKASYTIENSIIVPMFTMVVVILITLCFHMHDQVIIKNTILKLCIRQEFEEDAHTDTLIKDGESYISEKALQLKRISINMEESILQYRFYAKAELFSNISSFKKWNAINKDSKITKNKPDEFIRKINAVRELID